MAIGLLLLSQASSYRGALGARVVWLLGYRVAFVCVMTSIALVAPPQFRSTAMGILGALASLASVIGAPFGTIIAEPYGWRGGIIGFAVMALLGAAVFWFGYKSGAGSGEVSVHPHGPSMPTRSAFRTPVVWSMVLLGLINMGGFSATFFVPSAVRSTFHLCASQSAYLISASYVVAIFVNLLFGYLCDKFDRWDMMIGLAVVLIPACFAMMIPNLLAFRSSHRARDLARTLRDESDLRAGRRRRGTKRSGAGDGRGGPGRRRLRIRGTAGLGAVCAIARAGSPPAGILLRPA